MKKIGFLVVAVSLSLSLAALAAEKPSNTKTPSSTPKTKGQKARTGGATPQTLANQIAQLKQEQQAAIKELEEVKKLAAEEKATKTVAALDRLIARHNQEYQNRIELLEQAQKKLEAGRKPAAEAPKKVNSKAKTGK